MTSPPRTTPSGPRPPDRGNFEKTSFTRNLRYELAGEEGRAMLGSYAISFALGLAFLLFVYLYPPIEEQIEPPAEVTIVELDPEQPPPPQPEPEAEAPAAAPQRQPATPREQPRRTQQSSGGDVSTAFRGQSGTGGFAGNVAGVLSGVDVSSGTGGTPGAAGRGTRAVISGASGTGTAATPGIGGVQGDAGVSGGIGNVGGTGGVGRARVGVSQPRPVDVPDIGRSRNMGDLGTYVRSRQAELKFCYQEHGLKVNPNLAGTITVGIGIAESGGVTSASINNRTWSGAGVSAVESCVLSKIRAWRFPQASGVGTGTYAFPFNFTR